MKSIFKVNLNRTSKILRAIDKADIISFDIFDTLLLRPFVHPFDVFSYLEEFFNIPGYKNARLQAENQAREAFPEKREITLDDIYSFVPEKFYFMKSQEEEFELTILQANQETLDIYNYAKQKNKSIIIVSDMYLSKDVLTKSLHKNGFVGYDKIFISSDIGCRKSDGALFKYVQKYLNVSAKSILHIGDNIESDYRIPRKFGFNAILYTPIIKSFFANKKHVKFEKIYKEGTSAIFSLLVGMQIIRWHNKKKSSYWEDIGYSLGGIFIYAYVKFIVDILVKKSATDVFFVARDGYMLSKVFSLFDETRMIKNHYVYAPRFVRIVGLREGLENASYFQFFKENIVKNYPHYENLFSREISLENILKNKDIERYCTSVLTEYKKYINTLKVAGNNIYMVDLGSNSASAQKILSFFFPNELKAGFYFALGKKNKVSSFIYDNSSNPLFFEEFIEFLITSQECPIVNFLNNEPVFKKPDVQDLKNTESLKLLQQGEFQFVKDIKHILGKFQKDVSSDILKKYMNLFFQYLTDVDIENLKHIFWFYEPSHTKSVPFYDVLKNKYGVR